MNNILIKYGLLLISATSIWAAPQIIIATKQKRGLSFNVGVLVKCGVTRLNLKTNIVQRYKAAYFLADNATALFSPQYAALGDQDRVSVLKGLSPWTGQAAPSENDYTTMLFAQNERVSRFYIAPKDYEASGEVSKPLGFSAWAIDVTAGLTYSIDKFIGFWFSGTYSFGLNNEITSGLSRLHYDIGNKKSEDYKAVQGNNTINFDAVHAAYDPFHDDVATDVRVSLNVLESFSVLIGGRYTPVSNCALDLGAGIRRYVVQCKWHEGTYSYPHSPLLYTENYLDEGRTFLIPYKEPVLLEQTFWPFVLRLGFSYVARDMHCITVSFDYATFEGSLQEKNPPEVRTSKVKKEQVGTKRVQKHPAYPTSQNLRPVNDMRNWVMSPIEEIEVAYSAHVMGRIFSFAVGYSLYL